MKRDDLLDLNDVLQHPGRTLAVDISTELPDEEDLDLVHPLEGFLEAVSTGNVLLIKGRFTACCVLECARCAGPIESKVEFEIDEQFQVEGIPSSLSPQDYARVVADEPYALFDENNMIVEALLRQALWLSMPMQALCTYGWDGDCPQARERGIKAQQSLARPEFETLRNLIDLAKAPATESESGESSHS